MICEARFRPQKLCRFCAVTRSSTVVLKRVVYVNLRMCVRSQVAVVERVLLHVVAQCLRMCFWRGGGDSNVQLCSYSPSLQTEIGNMSIPVYVPKDAKGFVVIPTLAPE